MRLWILAPLLLATGVACGTTPGVSAGEGRLWQKVERFDRDPGWDAARNRISLPPKVKQQDFGYRRDAAGLRYGRIGGTVWRSLTPASYARRLPALTFDDAFSASGTLALTQSTTTVGYENGSTVFAGFFNHREQGWRPVDFVGFRLEGYNEPDGATVEISYGTRLWTAGGTFVNRGGGDQERNVRELDHRELLRVAPDGQRHTWSLRYDPAGPGTITFVFDGAETVHPLRPELRKLGARIDRFGFFNGQLPGNELTAYFDDLVVNGERIDLSVDPRWEGQGNRARVVDRAHYGSNDFGYSRTRYAGGGRGELGGRAWRVQEPELKGYYGDDVGTLTLNDPLSASGTLAFPAFSIDSGMHLGWFNSREQGWPPKSFVGVYLDSLSTAGRFFAPMYGTSRARREGEPGAYRLRGAAFGGPELLFYPDGRRYEWSLRYDPSAAGGSGALTVGLGAQSLTLPLEPGARAEGAVMDRFGVFNMQDNNGKACVFYLDNLRYTSAHPGQGR
ncbi:MAG: hypothetical protein ACK47B_13435 [Armatimonadota bacterium]